MLVFLCRRHDCLASFSVSFRSKRVRNVQSHFEITFYNTDVNALPYTYSAVIDTDPEIEF